MLESDQRGDLVIRKDKIDFICVQELSGDGSQEEWSRLAREQGAERSGVRAVQERSAECPQEQQKSAAREIKIAK